MFNAGVNELFFSSAVAIYFYFCFCFCFSWNYDKFSFGGFFLAVAFKRHIALLLSQDDSGFIVLNQKEWISFFDQFHRDPFWLCDASVLNQTLYFTFGIPSNQFEYFFHVCLQCDGLWFWFWSDKGFGFRFFWCFVLPFRRIIVHDAMICVISMWLCCLWKGLGGLCNLRTEKTEHIYQHEIA